MRSMKNVMRRCGALLLSLALVLSLLPVTAFAAGPGDVVYVSGAGSDDKDGTTADNAVATMQKAYELVADGGTIVLCGNVLTEHDKNDEDKELPLVLPAKNVTITSNDGTTDYSKTAVWSGLRYIDFQGNTTLKNITLASESEGYGFIANGYDFTVDEGVTVNGNGDLYIIGGANGPGREDTTVKPGANITVKSGTKWIIYGAGQDCDGTDNTGDINIIVSGKDTQVKQLCAAYKQQGTVRYEPSQMKNSTMTVADGATVYQVMMGSDCRFAGTAEQAEDGVITLNMMNGTHFGSIIAGGLYGNNSKAEGTNGCKQELSNLVINYYGAAFDANGDPSGENIYLGGAELEAYSGFPTEHSYELTVNLYEDCDVVMLPAVATSAPGSVLKNDRVRQNIIKDSTFVYEDPGASLEASFTPAITRIVRYTDSGTVGAPQGITENYVPHIIEFASEDVTNAQYPNTPNVLAVSEDFGLNGISLDGNDTNIRLEGETVPVITATDFVNGYRLTENGLANTFENENPGKIVLNFIKNGENWQPEEGTVVFQVPSAAELGKDADEVRALGKEILAMFDAPEMEDGYYLDYQEGTYAGDPISRLNADGARVEDSFKAGDKIGQIVIAVKPAYTLKYNDDDATKDEEGVYNPNDPTELPAEPEREGYTFAGWYDDENCEGNLVTTTPDKNVGDVTYYAKWVPAEHTVTFNPNNGENTWDDTIKHGETATKPANDPTDASHVFTGWYTDPDCTTPYDFTTPVTGDITLYASWKQVKYTLHYGDGRPNDGEWGYNYADGMVGYYVPETPDVLPTQMCHFSKADIDAQNYFGEGVTVPGWYFLGWEHKCAEDHGDPIVENETPKEDHGDIDYYAHWVLIDIDIQIDIDIDIHGIEDKNDLVTIEETEKDPLAENVDVDEDVKGTNCEINVTAYVTEATDEEEVASADAKIEAEFGEVTERVDYDVSIMKTIMVDNELESETELTTLARPIQIRFAVPEEWQSGGKVYMYRTHRNEDTGVVTTTRLANIGSHRAYYTVSSKEFSTYTMIYIPGATGGSGTTGGGAGGGAGGGGAAATKNTLNYVSNGGTTYPAESYTDGTKVPLDKTPIREGYTFTGWYADEALTQPITEITMDKSATVYAGWKQTQVPAMLNGKDHFAYVIGYPDGLIRPNKNISRAEAATIYFRLLNDAVRTDNLATANTFDDVNDGLWCNKAISTMQKLGIINGRTETSFDPNAPITRAEFAAICARFSSDEAGTLPAFSDTANHWAKDEIGRAASFGWIQGYEDGTFRPNNLITRAEAMTMINRVLQRLPQTTSDLLDDMTKWDDNLDTNKWYYIAVQEATNSHDYNRDNGSYETWTELTENRDWTIYE